MSNVNPLRLPGPGQAPAAPAGQSTPNSTNAPRLPAFTPAPQGQSNSFPSAEGTAILNLTSEQFAGIKKLLIGLRLGKSIADDVRSEIFGMLTKGQRRVLPAAWFILSVRV